MTTRRTTHADRGRDQLLGAWRLVTWEVTEADGTVSHPLGEAVAGQLIYDDSGRMSAHLVRADRPPTGAADEWRQAGQDEMTTPPPGYFGYFGTFTVDAEAATVSHRVESGSFPDLAGTDQVRGYRFGDGRLILEAGTAWGEVRVVWERFR